MQFGHGVSQWKNAFTSTTSCNIFLDKRLRAGVSGIDDKPVRAERNGVQSLESGTESLSTLAHGILLEEHYGRRSGWQLVHRLPRHSFGRASSQISRQVRMNQLTARSSKPDQGTHQGPDQHDAASGVGSSGVSALHAAALPAVRPPQGSAHRCIRCCCCCLSCLEALGLPDSKSASIGPDASAVGDGADRVRCGPVCVWAGHMHTL